MIPTIEKKCVVKFNVVVILLLSLLGAFPGLSIARTLLDVSLDPSLLSPKIESNEHDKASSSFSKPLDFVLAALASYDDAWEKAAPHLAQSYLQSGVEKCKTIFEETNLLLGNPDRDRLVYACLILESEWINRVSPWQTFASAQRLDRYFQLTEKMEIPLAEKLYAEGRIYSALPGFYGQDLKRALVSLEFLKRLEKDSSLSEPWIIRARKLQGKAVENIPDLSSTDYLNRKETDGLLTGIFPMVYGSFPQGIGVQIRAHNGALWDTHRKLQSRFFATHRGSLGWDGKLEDFNSLSNAKAVLQFQYLHGIQEYHGLGIESPKPIVDLYLNKLVADLFIQKAISNSLYFKLGWRLHSTHVRKIEEGNIDNSLIGIPNAFDSGGLTEVGYDTRDSEYEPYRGQRVYLQGYFPRQSIGSSFSFDRILLWGEGYWPLNLKTQVKLYSAFCSLSDTAPFGWYSQLSGTIPFPGLRPTRYMDRSLLALGGEIRWKRWSPLTLFAFSNAATLGNSTKNIFQEKLKIGGGLGTEIHLTRFRPRAFRFEMGNFGGEWSFNSMLGIPLD